MSLDRQRKRCHGLQTTCSLVPLGLCRSFFLFWGSPLLPCHPLSWLRSPPQVHLFVLLEALCRGGRLSVSCCLKVRSLASTCLDTDKAPSGAEPLGPLWSLMSVTELAPVGHQPGDETRPREPPVRPQANSSWAGSQTECGKGEIWCLLEHPRLPPSPHASVHSTFRRRISPWGMGIAAQAKGR